MPVRTTVGNAVSEPTGTDGLVWAEDRMGTRTQMQASAAETAAWWLVFMAGCKGVESAGVTWFQRAGDRLSGVTRSTGFQAWVGGDSLAMPDRDRWPGRGDRQLGWDFLAGGGDFQ